MSSQAEIAVDINDPQIRRASPGFGYYRQPNGYITVSVTSAMERMNYMEEGWQPLTQYGSFDMATEYMANHPFEPLFMQGGAGELPLRQVIDNGFHVKAPIIPRCGQPLGPTHKRHSDRCWPGKAVVFPQLPEDTPKFPCRFEGCNRSLPGSELPTKSALDRHETVMHKEERGDITTGNVLGEAIVKGLANIMTKSTNLDTPEISSILAGMKLTEAQKLYLLKNGIQLNLPEESSSGQDNTSA